MSTHDAGMASVDDAMRAPHGATTTNPFRNALQMLAKKKPEKPTTTTATSSFATTTTSNATTGFFSRAAKGVNKAQPLPGSVRQVCGGQLPPVWTEPLVPVRKASAPSEDHLVAAATTTTTSSAHASESEASDGSVSIATDEDGHATAVSKRSSSATGSAPGSKEVSSHEASEGAAPSRHMSKNSSGTHRCEQFAQLMASDVIDLDKLKELSWGGIPTEHRPTAWRILLGNMPSKRDRREQTVQRKRQEYRDLLHQYYYIPDTERGAKEQATLRQILLDIPRTNADVRLFKNERIHQCMERILYTWALRHPASGYVQGINDLLMPFLVVFLSSYLNNPEDDDLLTVSDDLLGSVEADSYWCLSKLLDGIQDHYTFAQPGLQRMVHRMEDLVHRCDATLHQHIVEQENVQFLQFAFRWMNCLLMRELPLYAIIRLWDTYLCEDDGFESFHVYVCAAILMTFGDKLKTLEFQDLVQFLQHLPTSDWTEDEIDPLLSRAFILQSYFADAPSHLT